MAPVHSHWVTPFFSIVDECFSFFVDGGRVSETFAGLLNRRDERFNHIDAQATQIAGIAVIVAVIIGFLVELAQGEDGAPYAMLGAIGGVAYIGSIVFLALPPIAQ